MYFLSIIPESNPCKIRGKQKNDKIEQKFLKFLGQNNRV